MKLFDFDGTLVDSNGVWLEVDRQFLGRLGLPLTREYQDLMGHSTLATGAQRTKDLYHLDLTPQEIMDQWRALAGDAYRNQVPLKPGAEAFLRRCREAGEPTVLLTSCVKEFCLAAQARLGIADAFTCQFFSEELGIEKKDPAAYTLLLNRLGVAPEACTFYEDSPGACAAARQAGLTVVGVLDPFYAHHENELRRICHRCIRSFEELLD